MFLNRIYVALRVPGSFNGRRRFIHAVFASEDGNYLIEDYELRNIHRGVLSGYDSHVHTNASDGQRTPRGLAREISALGQTVVVTDHYSLNGATDAMDELQIVREEAGGCIQSEIVAGIEFSVSVKMPSLPQIRKLHILGLAVDPKSRRLKEWLIDYRKKRCSDIDHALTVRADLEGLGFSFEDCLDLRLRNKRNVYQVLAESIFCRPCNRRLLERHFDVMVPHVASRHKRRMKNAQARRRMVKRLRFQYGDFRAAKPRLQEVVELIKAAGGMAVVAHPVASVPQLPHFSIKKMTEVFMELGFAGIDGIEAYTPKHRLEVADAIAKAAFDAGLYVTGGSDTHRMEHDIGRLAHPEHNFMRQARPSVH